MGVRIGTMGGQVVGWAAEAAAEWAGTEGMVLARREMGWGMWSNADSKK
jgi:hypothetical protein